MEEYNEENEFEDFDNSEDIKELSERMRIAMIEKSVDMNYKRMMSNGFSIKNIKTFTDAEKKEVIETLQYMINFYEEGSKATAVISSVMREWINPPFKAACRALILSGPPATPTTCFIFRKVSRRIEISLW